MLAGRALFMQEMNLEEQWEDEEFTETVDDINMLEHVKQVRPGLAGSTCCQAWSGLALHATVWPCRQWSCLA